MIKSKNKYLIIITIIAVAAGIVLLIIVSGKDEMSVTKNKNDIVDRIHNLLTNSSFEEEFDKNSWRINNLAGSHSGFDILIKQNGNYSFNLISNESNTKNFISQKIIKVQRDRKFSLLGFIKTEDCDSARFEIEIYNGDSLLVNGYSKSIKGTTDWQEYNAWIKTYLNKNINENKLSALVKCILYGKGKVWFDNLRLYAIPLDDNIYDLESYVK